MSAERTPGRTQLIGFGGGVEEVALVGGEAVGLRVVGDEELLERSVASAPRTTEGKLELIRRAQANLAHREPLSDEFLDFAKRDGRT